MINLAKMHKQRFFSYLTLFSFFMILLVTADNYLLMFLAWEGIGVVSYLLINFWFTRIAATKAAVLALTQNRVGDTLLTLGLFGMLWAVGNLDYSTVFSIMPYMNETVTTIIALLLLGGASAKSAQLFLNTWLPHSMEGFMNNLYRLYNQFIFYFILYIIYCLWSSLDLGSSNFISTGWCTLPVLSNKVFRPLIGDLLGDGHLRYGNKNKLGEYTGNCLFAMTLKSESYASYLREKVYSDICTSSGLWPWPNPKTGRPVTQYHFKTKSLEALTLIHSQWYILDENSNKYCKIVPLNIDKLLSPIGLAHWIMGDGYWSDNTLFLCTDSFTYDEVILLINSLNTLFNIEAGSLRRTKENKKICWRIRLSSKKENIIRLRTIVAPFMISSLKYKIGEL